MVRVATLLRQNGTCDLPIGDASRPLAGGFPNGVIQVFENDAARQRLARVTNGTIAPDAKFVATLPGNFADVPDVFANADNERIGIVNFSPLARGRVRSSRN